jgi:hypothetical protein
MRAGLREISLSLILFLAAIAVYWQTCAHGFTNYDDPQYIKDNHEVNSGLSRANVVWAFTTFDDSNWHFNFHAGNWHPLTWLSLQLDSQLFGPKPWGYHFTNVMLHAANTVLLFWALWTMTHRVWLNGFVAAFFALHPLHVESVAWLAERKDVLSTFFWMAACLAYGWYAARPSWARYLLTLAAFAMGLLAKPMVVTLPFVLLLLDYWPLGRFGQRETSSLPADRRPHSPQGTHELRSAPLTTHQSPHTTLTLLLLEKLPFFILAAGSCAITWHAQQYLYAVRSLDEYPFSVRALNAMDAYGAYIGQMMWPVDLGVFYPHPKDLLSHSGIAGLISWRVVGATLLLFGATLFACAKMRSYPYLLVGWFWYVGTLVPVIGLVQVGAAARADRYTYVPLVGLFIALAWGVADLLVPFVGLLIARLWGIADSAARRPAQLIVAGLGVVSLVAFTALTAQQIDYWRSNVTLWEHTLAACGDSTVARMNLGRAFVEQGRSEEMAHRRVEAKRSYEAAEEQFRIALELDKSNPGTAHDIGVAVARQGRIEEAIPYFRQAVKRNPNWARAHYDLAAALADFGRKQVDARDHQVEVLVCAGLAFESDLPLRLLALDRLKRLHYRTELFLEAMAEYEEVTRCDPRSVRFIHRKLGDLLQSEGRNDEANRHFRAAAEGGVDVPPGSFDPHVTQPQNPE